MGSGSRAERYQVVIHTDAADADGVRRDGALRARRGAGQRGDVAAHGVRRRAGRDVCTGDGDVVSVGRRTRTIPPTSAARSRNGTVGVVTRGREPLHRGPPRQALGRRRRDEPGQHDPALSPAPPPGPRGQDAHGDGTVTARPRSSRVRVRCIASAPPLPEGTEVELPTPPGPTPRPPFQRGSPVRGLGSAAGTGTRGDGGGRVITRPPAAAAKAGTRACRNGTPLGSARRRGNRRDLSMSIADPPGSAAAAAKAGTPPCRIRHMSITVPK